MEATQCPAGRSAGRWGSVSTRRCHRRACQCGGGLRAHSRIQSGRYSRQRSKTLREAVRELEAFARASAREVGAHRRDRGLAVPLCEAGQGVVDAPAQAGRRVGALAADSGDRGAHDRPGEVRGELEAEIRGDVERACKLQGQPARHAPVRHHDALRFEGVARSGEHPFREDACERLQAVRVMEAQHLPHPLPSREDWSSRRPESPPFFTKAGIDPGPPISSTATIPRPCVSVDSIAYFGLVVPGTREQSDASDARPGQSMLRNRAW